MTDQSQRVHYGRRLRIRLAGWLDSEEGRHHPHAHHLARLPDLFALALALLLDDRLAYRHRAALLNAVVYVVNCRDFCPEDVVGTVGYLDDAVVLAHALSDALRLLPDDSIELLWEGDDHPERYVRAILDDADDMLGAQLGKRIETWINDS